MRLRVPGPDRKAGADHSVLDVGTSQPVFHKGLIRTGGEQVRRDGVLQTMELVLLRRQACFVDVAIHATTKPERGDVTDAKASRMDGPPPTRRTSARRC